MDDKVMDYPMPMGDNARMTAEDWTGSRDFRSLVEMHGRN